MKYLNPAKDAVTWKKRYTTALGDQTIRFKKYADFYDALYAIVGKTAAPWRSKVYLPVLARQAWNLVAKFLVLRPGWQVQVFGQDDDSDNENQGNETPPAGVEDTASENLELKAEMMQRMLERDYDNPDLDESVRSKLLEPLMDAVVTGTGFAKPCWRVNNKKIYRRNKISKTGYADLTQEEVTTRSIGYNDLEPVNVFNVFTSREAGSNLYKAPWIIIKDRKLISDLKQVNQDQGIEVYRNLDKIQPSPQLDEIAQYNRSRDRLMNKTSNSEDTTIDMANIYECYEGNRVCTYAEAANSSAKDQEAGWVLIRDQQNIYWHGRYPLVKFHVKKRPFSFWGEGLFEITYRLQAAYNDIFNHYMDALNVSTDPMLIVPEKANVNDYVIEPAGVITYRGDQKPEQFKHAEPNPAQLQLVLGLMDQAIEGATISQYATGIPNSSSDKTHGTATGILRLQEAAGDIVQFFKDNFKESILQVGKMYLSNNQQFLQSPVTLSVTNGQKKRAVKVSPLDLQGEMELSIDSASMEPATDDEKRQNWLALVQQVLLIKQAADLQHSQLGTDPVGLNFTALLEETAEKFNMHNLDKVLMNQQQIQTAMQQGLQMAMQQMNPTDGGTKAKQPFESLNYKDAPEDIKRQMEQQAGFNPSQGISPAGSDQIAKHANLVMPPPQNPQMPNQGAK